MADTITKRNYVSLADVQAVESGATLAQVDLAEQIVDAYVGAQQRHIPQTFQGDVTAVTNSNKTFADTSSTTQLNQRDGYFIGCVLEIIGGTGAGQSKLITGSDESDKSVTITDAFTTTPDTTSVFRIYQLGKFPRVKDVFQKQDGTTYYKTIPDAVRQAVIAQVSFIIAKGNGFFTGDDGDKESESIGDYSYSRGNSGAQSAQVRMIGPRARTLLRGIKNSLGTLSAENPTCL